MNLPFTTEDFLQVFENYNLSVFPAQIFFNILAVLMIFLAVKRIKYSDKIIGFSLGFLWLWIGIVYHLVFFSKINPAAVFFAAIYILQGLLFIYFAGLKKDLNFSFSKDLMGLTGALFMLYALIIYPLLGILFGHTYPHNPTFGLPCPTTIFTFGLLLWSKERVPLYLTIIPLIWSLIGSSAAVKLGVLEDTGLLIAGVFGFVMIIQSNRKKLKPAIIV